jgi:hypothetical protein
LVGDGAGDGRETDQLVHLKGLEGVGDGDVYEVVGLAEQASGLASNRFGGWRRG